MPPGPAKSVRPSAAAQQEFESEHPQSEEMHFTNAKEAEHGKKKEKHSQDHKASTGHGKEAKHGKAHK